MEAAQTQQSLPSVPRRQGFIFHLSNDGFVSGFGFWFSVVFFFF